MVKIQAWWMPSGFTLDTDNDDSWKKLLKYAYNETQGDTAQELFEDIEGNAMPSLALECDKKIMAIRPKSDATNWIDIKTLLELCLPKMALRYFKKKAQIEEVVENGIEFFNKCINGGNDDYEGILCGNVRMYLENGIFPFFSWRNSTTLSDFDEDLWSESDINKAYRIYADVMQSLKLLRYPIQRAEENKLIHIVRIEFYSDDGNFTVNVLECLTNGHSRIAIINFLRKNAKELFRDYDKKEILWFF